jgi:hypothetical protein
MVTQSNILYVAVAAHTSTVFATDLTAGAWRQADVVAAIIAPGAKMTVVPNANQTAAGCVARTQSRTATTPNVLDYLECQNVSGSSITLRTRVVDNVTNPVSNDQMVLITAAEVMAAVEPMVAQRIQNQVVPQMQAIYADPKWGTSAANPVFPFPATYGDTATSTFKGSLSATCPADVATRTDCEGFLPVTALTCASTAASRCDPNYHTFNVAGISVSVTNVASTGPLTSWDCTSAGLSSTTQIKCTMSYLRLICVGICPMPAIKVEGDALNVGLAMRTFDTAAAATSGLSVSTVNVTAPLQSDGSARVTVTGNMTAGGSPLPLCGTFLSLLCSGSATVTIPISAFQDHPFLNPTTTDSWYWFFANNWHHVTYYAIAPVHQPGGAGSCTGATCISVTVTGGASLSDKRAVLALAGRSLNNTSGTNRALLDFLDDTNSTPAARTNVLSFKQYKGSRTFNDRFVSLSP